MSENIVQLHQPKPCGEVVATLRRIADDIEAGRHGDWPVTTAVLMIGHTDSEFPDENGTLIQQNYWSTYAAGTRTDSFTCRGLLASVLQRWGHDHED